MTRELPGVYVSLNDMSQLPEGATTLNVGFVLKANRGPVNQWAVVGSPTDFLNRYTFSGTPTVADDPTFWDILKVLAQTNSMYIVRAANNPLYGGVVVKKAKEYGKVVEVKAETEQIIFAGEEAPEVNEVIMITGTNVVDGYYIVKSVAGQTITVTGNITMDYRAPEGAETKLLRAPIAPLNTQKMAKISKAVAETKEFILENNVASRFLPNMIITVKNTDLAGYADNNGDYTVVSAEFDLVANETRVKVAEAVLDGVGGDIYANSLVDPEGYAFQEDDLMLITGIDPGAYNSQIAFTIISSVDNHDDLVYYPGADLGGKEPCKFGTMQLNVISTLTNQVLESFTFSKDQSAKTIDGQALFVDNVTDGSAYIKVINNPATIELPNSSLADMPLAASGGSDGGEVDENTLAAALEVFADKTIPLSILGNGCSAAAESPLFQSTMIELARTRQDMVVFLNSRKADEKATTPSDRAQKIVKYKKETLASTSFYGCMYAPHVKTSDTYNLRQVEIGADGVAIAGWLNVLNTISYPYVYAGPQNGQVNGVTCDWKIGDLSSEALAMNDASINYIAYDGKVGRYYMQAQNTLQIANSAMRNIGTVLNVLDLKENLAIYLKEFLQLPITVSLRRDIIDTVNDYLEPMVGVRFSNYSFQDVSSDFDIADNTLRYLLTLAPTPYAQKIYLVMNIVNATFDFSILQSM